MWWWLCCASSAALLSLLDFVCFEFLGSPMKSVEAGWLLEVSSHDISIFRCPFGYGHCHIGCRKAIIRQAWCHHFAMLEDHVPIQGHLGTPVRRPWDPGLDVEAALG